MNTDCRIYIFALVGILISVMTGCRSTDNDVFTTSHTTEALFANIAAADRAEVEYGYTLNLKVLANCDLVTDEAITRPVQELVNRLARHTERSSFPYTCTVLNDTRIFAVSSPGGYLYVSWGMVTFANGTPAMAAVLAHELGETQERPVSFTRRKHLANMAHGLSRYASYVFGPFGMAAPYGVTFLNNTLLREIPPAEAVITADERAVQYLRAEGFEPAELLSMVERTLSPDRAMQKRLKAYVTIRPVTVERLHRLRSFVAKGAPSHASP